MEPVSETQIRLLSEYAVASNPQDHDEAHRLICSLELRILNAINETFDQRCGVHSRVYQILNDALKRVDFLMELPENGRLSQDKREKVVALAEQLLPQELFADLRVKGRTKKQSNGIPTRPADSFYKCPCMHCLNNIEFPTHGIGALIECPHCGQQTELYDNDLFLPELTEQSFSRIKVRSSDRQTWYYVNLLEYTCTCPDFVGRRSEAPARHVFRICKHISHSLHPVYDKLSPIIKCIISEGRGVRPGEFRFDRNNNPVYITRPNEQGWINLFAPRRAAAKTYYSFGYNVVEKYWAYGEKPLINEADILV